jgi:hypothetical protein
LSAAEKSTSLKKDRKTLPILMWETDYHFKKRAMKENDDSYWVKVFRREALKYRNVGIRNFTDCAFVRIDKNTVKLIRKHAVR